MTTPRTEEPKIGNDLGLDPVVTQSRPRIRHRLLAALRPRRYDVVFYTPPVGAIVGSSTALPPGGAEVQVLAVAQALARRGVRVGIIVFRQTHKLPSSVTGVDLIGRPAYKKRRLSKVLEPLLIWRSLWHARSDSVVYRGAAWELGVIALYTRASGRHLVFSSANVGDFQCDRFLPRPRDRWLYLWGIRHTDQLVVQTKEQVHLCKEHFGRSSTLIRSIASLSEARTRPGEAFLWIGRLVSYKAPLKYLELARRVPEAQFWMVGVPTRHVPSDAAVADRTLHEAHGIANLTLIPPVPHDQLQGLLARAIASVNTADFEGMPNVLLEAWSKGVPALVLSHDPDGVISSYGLGGFAHGSMDELVELTRAYWANPDADRTLIEGRCRAYMAAHHDPSVVAAGWQQILRPQ